MLSPYDRRYESPPRGAVEGGGGAYRTPSRLSALSGMSGLGSPSGGSSRLDSTPRAGVATPSKIRVDAESLEALEGWLARFQTTPCSSEWFASLAHCLRLEDADADAMRAALQRVASGIEAQSSIAGLHVARVAVAGPSAHAGCLRDLQEADLIVFVSNLPPCGADASMLEKLADAIEPHLTQRQGCKTELFVLGGSPGVVQRRLRCADVRKSRVAGRVGTTDVSARFAPCPADAPPTAAIAAVADAGSAAARDAEGAASREAVAAFLASRPVQALEMVRLALAWRALNLLARRIKAPALLFELLGCMAYNLAARRTPGETPGLDLCYREFLKMIESYKTLEVRWGANYELGEVPADILRQRPLVLDPCCARHNVAQGMASEAWRKARRIAGACNVALELGRKTGAGNLADAFKAQDYF